MILTGSDQELDFVAFVGIDWADQKHAWALQSAGTSRIEQGCIDATPAAVEAWAAGLIRRFGEGRIAIALEQSRGALLFMLTKYAQFVLFPVHPTTVAKYRDGFRPSGAKSDPSDAALILDLLVRHREQLRRFDPDTPETRTLQFLVEERRKFVADKTRLSNRLTARLKMYFPQILDWFAEVSSEITGDFLERWPTLEKLQKARAETLSRFFNVHHSCQDGSIERRLEEISRAVPATRDTAVNHACSIAALSLVRLLREVRRIIGCYDQEIESLARQHPDFAIFDSLPGAGSVLTPRLIAAFGTRRDRYNTASELQSYSGIAPVLASSGKQSWVHWRWACPKFLRQTFHEWAAHSFSSCVWAKAYYEQQRVKGKSRQAAVRALAFKWIRIVFRCWKNRQPYDEPVYLEAIARRGAAPMSSSVQMQWKSSAGFTKFAGLIS